MGLYEDEVNGVMQELLKEHDILGPLVKQIPESIQEMNRKRSVENRQKAIDQDLWEDFIKETEMQTITLARIGVSLEDVVSLLKIPIEKLQSKFEAHYNNSFSEAMPALRGMGLFIDFLVQIMAKTYLKMLQDDLLVSRNELAKMVFNRREMIFAVSHQLQEPITRTETVLLQIKDSGILNQTELCDDLVVAEDSVKKMNSLLYDLMTFVKIGEMSVPSVGDINLLVKQALDKRIVENRLSQAEVQLGPLPTVLKFYPKEMSVLLDCLIDNAIVYQRKDVPLRLEIGCQKQGEFWEFWVKDNGIGIKPESLQKIFEIYSREALEVSPTGTGMGLAISMKICELHHGKIWAESLQGNGSIFKFTLPQMIN